MVISLYQSKIKNGIINNNYITLSNINYKNFIIMVHRTFIRA